MNSFCLYHTLQFFLQYDPLKSRVDTSVHNYFKKNKALGSKDRKIIAEFIYKYVRFRTLIEHVLHIRSIQSQEDVFNILRFEPEDWIESKEIPTHVKYGFKKDFLDYLSKSFNSVNLEQFLKTNLENAPTYGRVNPLKISRDDLLQRLSTRYIAEPTKRSCYGIKFNKRINFSSDPDYKNGLFEIQDESSQLAALELNPQPCEKILDFCAGGGGKSLLIGALMQNRGQLFLHDVRADALVEAKKRLKRAGVQNFQILSSDFSRDKFYKFFDRVFLDVPCSGTGTLRRNPDMIGRLNIADLKNLVELQRKIFDETFPLLKKGGYILWATCSVLKEENEEQIDYFLEKYKLQKAKPALKIMPETNSSDGFFAQLLQVC
jgi:16S rRNA (cytosine967-C5)-methyltransferase